MISAKYRSIHPSMVGVCDLAQTSNSDVGTSGSFTPFVKIYDSFYFTPDKEPCQARYLFEKALSDEEENSIPRDIILNLNDFDSYIRDIEKKQLFMKDLSYEKIEIIEKDI